MATYNMILFERPRQKFDTIFDWTLQEVPKTKAPQYQYHPKWVRNKYWSEISYNQKIIQ